MESEKMPWSVYPDPLTFRSRETRLSFLAGLVSVQQFSPIPRLSIVVPIGRDLAAFESTLISVLENRPEDCEVLVSHDGSYDDPFELCDEVRFVTAPNRNLVDLVSAGAASAKARFVHVISNGIRATAGWTEEALEKFEHFDAGSVAPVIRHEVSDEILAAGWYDRANRLCEGALQGIEEIDRYPEAPIGTYLQASFWRTELLRSLSDAFTTRCSDEASYAYDHLIRAAGWNCVLATDCDLTYDAETLPWDSTSLGRGQRLRAVQNHFRQGGWASSVIAATGAAIASLLSPRSMTEAFGQALAPLSANRLNRQMRPQAVLTCDPQETIIAIPQRSAPLRRAA